MSLSTKPRPPDNEGVIYFSVIPSDPGIEKKFGKKFSSEASRLKKLVLEVLRPIPERKNPSFL